ncbi:hypothetical protein Acr_15g0004880 [Actinidia rufa]|uniref:TF-B3 domain-containing protein n=1 Tax=Actinidia rufa TaxID=165716 RepID=A0A7J0FT43_9ERIC|nr:hypothetical protein Acr_15g0004880 [Actinidia rufa]
MRLTESDVEQDKLCIPVEFALDHFPPIPTLSPRCYEDYEEKRVEGFAQSHEMKAKDVVEVRKYFRDVGIPAETHNVERLYFTDAKNTDWCMKITMFNDWHTINGPGWDQCVKDYHLEPGDFISFYRSRDGEDTVGKRLEDMKAQQEVEMEKAKDTSKGGISSSSTSLKETATETKSGCYISLLVKITQSESEGMKAQQEAGMEKAKDASKSGISSSSTPLKETASDTKSGESSWTRRPGKEILQETDPINKRDRRKIFLFEKHLTDRDVQHGVLSIPVELALDRFPPLPEIRLDIFEAKIEVTDAQGHISIMGIGYDHANSLFLIDSGWRGFAKHHGLRTMDRVRFYIPIPCLKENVYLIEYVRTEEFREGNFLFEKELTRDEAKYSKWLRLPPLEGRFPFPRYRIYYSERLCFTDAVNRDWWFTFQFQNGNYCVISGWEGFRNEYKLEEGDVIKFYKPVWPRSSQYFLIQHAKRDEAARTPAKKDGCMPNFSGMKKHGRGGGRGQTGKKFVVGDCCVA